MNDKFYYAETYHHIYNRGTLQTNIFFDEEDFNYFLNRLRKFKDRYKIKIICFCLLNNHFHIFAKQTDDKLTIGKFIGDMQNAHTKFMNKKYSRTGVLFEGPAKTKFVKEKIYNKWIIEYILLNPVEAKLINNATNWKYSTANELLVEDKDWITSLDELIMIYGSLTNVKKSFEELKTNSGLDKYDFDLVD